MSVASYWLAPSRSFMRLACRPMAAAVSLSPPRLVCVSSKGLCAVSSRLPFHGFSLMPLALLAFCPSSCSGSTSECTHVFVLSIHLPPSSLFLSPFIPQTSSWSETTTTVCARRRATWRATAKRCPLSRYPAKLRPSTSPRNSTKQSST